MIETNVNSIDSIDWYEEFEGAREKKSALDSYDVLDIMYTLSQVSCRSSHSSSLICELLFNNVTAIYASKRKSVDPNVRGLDRRSNLSKIQ